MNYEEQLKEQEIKLTNFRAQTLAKKKNAEEFIERRKKQEEECQSKLSISLSEVPAKMALVEEEMKKFDREITEEVENIEREFLKIK